MPPAPRSMRARLPWAALLAVALVLGFDAWLFGRGETWQWLERTRPPRAPALEKGLIHDRVERARAAARPARLPRVYVVGSSRAQRGFDVDAIDRALAQRLAIARLAHARVQPIEIRSMVDEIVDDAPDAVVLMLSEFDTHRPLLLVPQATAGSLSAVVDLVRVGGAAFARRQRDALLRMVAVAALDAYRYRDVLGCAFVDRLRRFPLDATRFEVPDDELFWFAQLRPEDREALGEDYIERFTARLVEATDAPENVIQMEVAQVAGISRGEHATIKTHMLRRAIEELHEAGIAVLIVETPLRPVARNLYDTTIRAEFLAFANDLAARLPRVSFVPLERLPSWDSDDFSDLTHLSEKGARAFTPAVMTALMELLRAS